MQIRSLFPSVTNVIISIDFEVSYALLLVKYGFVLFTRNLIFVWDRLRAEYYVESSIEDGGTSAVFKIGSKFLIRIFFRTFYKNGFSKLV